MNEIISAGLAVLGTIFVALISLYGAKKVGIGQTQERLVASLRELVETQDKKIIILEKDSLDKDRAIKILQEEVAELKRLTIRQARIITRLVRNRKSLEEIEELELDEHV